MASDSSSSATFDSSSAGEPDGRLLTVSVETQKGFVVNRDTGYRVRVTVTAARGVDAGVFRYKYVPPTGTNTPTVRYDGVCSPTDLAAYPAGDPLPDAFPAFCRRDVVDLVFRSTSEAADMLATLREELQVLIDSLNRMDVLELTDVLTFQ